MPRPISVLSFIIHKKFGELLLQRFDFWTITNLNVGIVGVVERVILMVVLGTVEALQRRQTAGYITEPFSNVLSALAKARIQPPSLFLLDIMMPGEDGLEFCQRLRGVPEFSKTPIIFVTAKGSDDDRILGFECGGDDYITKPFSPRELVARVNAALRKHEYQAAILRFRELEIDTAAMILRVRGVEKVLTSVEFRILEMLARSPGQVFSRERILRILGSDSCESSPRAVDAFISKIRAKIEDDPGYPNYLLTIRGVGYRFVGR